MANLGVMVANVRRNLGEEAQQFYLSTEIKQYIGEGYRHFYLPMVEEEQGYFETTVNLPLTQGVEAVDLSTLDPAFFQISALEKNTSSGSIVLRRNERRFRNNLNTFVGSGESYLPDYKMRGINLILETAPPSDEAASSSTGLKLDYVFQPEFPISSSLDAFTFDPSFPAVYEPMIELYATIAALEAKDAMGGVSDVSTFRARLDEWQGKFLNSLTRAEQPTEIGQSGEYY